MFMAASAVQLFVISVKNILHTNDFTICSCFCYVYNFVTAFPVSGAQHSSVSTNGLPIDS